MSLFTTPGRITVAAWKHFIRNIWLALTTVFVLVLAILSVNVLVGVNALLTNATQILQNKVDIAVYFKEGTSQDVLNDAKFFMDSLPQVQSAELLTADQALQDFKARHAEDPKIIDALNELDQNPLGGTLVIKAHNTSDYSFLLQALQNPQFSSAIDSKDFDDHSDVITRVQQLSQSVRLFGYGLVLIFAIFSVLIVFNTIRVAIYTQREEIGVMRLVGASSAYVRFPFVLEGIFLALFALIISGFIVFGAAAYLDPRLATVFDGASPGLVAYFTSNVLMLAAVEGGGLAILVGLSSWAAAGKYLKK
ncbi:MAG: permease-like cell division protein FtsX [Patescibacteria group bacterium]